MKLAMQPPDGIVITISKSMIGDNGYRHWLRNFLEAMKESEKSTDWFYWLRAGNRPKADVQLQYVYLCIGGKIRFRAFYAGSHGPREMQFVNHSKPMFGKAWITIAGPVERPPHPIVMKGFQGFRYTQKIF